MKEHIFSHQWLAGVIAAHHEGKLVGRLRLQKTVYLLQRLGLPTNYAYRMFHYGPYSDGLKSEVGLLEMLDLVEETAKTGTREYFEIKAKQGAQLDAVAPFQPAIQAMNRYPVEALELAATYDFYYQNYRDHQEALKWLERKKADKCGQYLDTAMELLRELGTESAPVA